MDVQDLITESFGTAKEKGWHDEDRTFGDIIALIHSETSEALEDYRHGHAPNELWLDEKGKPCGIPSEFADILIRVFDACGMYDIDLDAALKAKMEYNRLREYRHGGKVI